MQTAKQKGAFDEFSDIVTGTTANSYPTDPQFEWVAPYLNSRHIFIFNTGTDDLLYKVEVQLHKFSTRVPILIPELLLAAGTLGEVEIRSLYNNVLITLKSAVTDIPTTFAIEGLGSYA